MKMLTSKATTHLRREHDWEEVEHPLTELAVVSSIVLQTLHRGSHISVSPSLQSFVELCGSLFEVLYALRLLQGPLSKCSQHFLIDVDSALQRYSAWLRTRGRCNIPEDFVSPPEVLVDSEFAPGGLDFGIEWMQCRHSPPRNCVIQRNAKEPRNNLRSDVSCRTKSSHPSCQVRKWLRPSISSQWQRGRRTQGMNEHWPSKGMSSDIHGRLGLKHLLERS